MRHKTGMVMCFASSIGRFYRVIESSDDFYGERGRVERNSSNEYPGYQTKTEKMIS